jgi:hypothetical protein
LKQNVIDWLKYTKHKRGIEGMSCSEGFSHELRVWNKH